MNTSGAGGEDEGVSVGTNGIDIKGGADEASYTGGASTDEDGIAGGMADGGDVMLNMDGPGELGWEWRLEARWH